MTANLAQPCQRGEHMDLALVESLFRDDLCDLFAAPAEFGQVQLALVFAKFAVAALLDAVWQILRDLLLQASQHQRPQLRGKPAARNFLHGNGALSFGSTRLVGFTKFLLGAEIGRLNEINDAPQIE